MKKLIFAALAVALTTFNAAAVFAQEDAPVADIIEFENEVMEIEPSAWYVAAAEAIGVSVEDLSSEATIALVAQENGVKVNKVIKAVERVALAEVAEQVEEEELNDRKATRLENRVKRAVRKFVRSELGDLSNADIQRIRWELNGWDNYTFKIYRPCFCLVEEFDAEPLTYYVTVENGEAVKVEKKVISFFADVDNPEVREEEIIVELDRATSEYLFITLDDVIQIAENAELEGVASLVTEYHTMRGYPTLVSIDYDSRIADEELHFEISEVKRTRN